MCFCVLSESGFLRPIWEFSSLVWERVFASYLGIFESCLEAGFCVLSGSFRVLSGGGFLRLIWEFRSLVFASYLGVFESCLGAGFCVLSGSFRVLSGNRFLRPGFFLSYLGVFESCLGAGFCVLSGSLEVLSLRLIWEFLSLVWERVFASYLGVFESCLGASFCVLGFLSYLGVFESYLGAGFCVLSGSFRVLPGSGFLRLVRGGYLLPVSRRVFRALPEISSLAGLTRNVVGAGGDCRDFFTFANIF